MAGEEKGWGSPCGHAASSNLVQLPPSSPASTNPSSCFASELKYFSPRGHRFFSNSPSLAVAQKPFPHLESLEGFGSISPVFFPLFSPPAPDCHPRSYGRPARLLVVLYRAEDSVQHRWRCQRSASYPGKCERDCATASAMCGGAEVLTMSASSRSNSRDTTKLCHSHFPMARRDLVKFWKLEVRIRLARSSLVAQMQWDSS